MVLATHQSCFEYLSGIITLENKRRSIDLHRVTKLQHPLLVSYTVTAPQSGV